MIEKKLQEDKQRARNHNLAFCPIFFNVPFSPFGDVPLQNRLSSSSNLLVRGFPRSGCRLLDLSGARENAAQLIIDRTHLVRDGMMGYSREMTSKTARPDTRGMRCFHFFLGDAKGSQRK